MRSESYPELVWDPRLGYRCSACEWHLALHIQSNLPEEDEIAQRVRKKFANHVSEKHPG